MVTMAIRQLFISFILCFLLYHQSLAQVVFDDYNMTTWNSKNGLPTELILDIVRDQDNFLWLNTYEGLIRFDGVQFKSFNNSTHGAFKTNNLYRPMVDNDGNLWIATQFGEMLKLKGNKVTSLPGIPKVSRVISRFDNGVFFYWTIDRKLMYFNPKSLEYKIQPLQYFAQYLKTVTAPDIAIHLDDGRMLICDSRVLYMAEGDSVRMMTPEEATDPDLEFCSNMLKTSDGEIFLVHDNGLKIWKGDRFYTYPGTENIKINTLGGNRKPLLVEDKSGNLWLGHSNGVALRKRGEKVFRFLPKGHPLLSVIVTCINVDDENNIWLGTETGLFKITKSKIRTISDIGFSVLKRTTGVASRKNGDIMIMAPSDYSIYNYRNGVASPIQFKTPEFKGSWEAFQIKEDSKGNVWIGGGISLVIKPDGKELIFSRTESIRNIYEDENGKIWFAIPQKGIGYLEGDSLKILPINYDFKGENVSSINKINGNEWLISSFNNGITWVKSDGKVFSIKDTLGFPGAGVFKTLQNSPGTFWVAANIGLFYFNGKSFLKIKNDKSYLNNSFFDIIPDKRGDFWLPSNKGIVQIPYEELEKISKGITDKIACIRYDDGDGMMNRQCTGARHSVLSHDGRIMIPTLHGLAIVDPESMGQNTIVPRVIITGLNFNGKVIDTIHPVFEPGVHQYIIEYSATSYTAPSKVEFRFMLEGYDKDWSAPTADRKVTYTNLPSGDYTFKVLASNNDGVWTKVPAVFHFSVGKYIYEYWWFKLLLLAGLGAVVYGIVTWRSKQILQKNKELEELVQQRTKNLHQANTALETQKTSLEKTLNELKSTQAQLIQSEKMASLGELTAGIAHEIQNPLNFVNNFSEVSNELIGELVEEVDKGNTEEVKLIAKDVQQNLEKINHHGKRADAIVKSMLLHSQKGSGKKEPTDINILCEEYLRLAYHGMKAKDQTFGASFRFQPDATLPLVSLVPQDIGRVLLNLINNAFQAVDERVKWEMANVKGDSSFVSPFTFHFKPLVTVSTKRSGDGIEISVKDNGPGIPEAIRDKIFQPFFTTKPTGLGTGLGLSLSYDIVKAHGGELKVETIESEGSTFILHLPA
jgi:signal transduction histidine kinase/ligand-binding sensor domain-containing protein